MPLTLLVLLLETLEKGIIGPGLEGKGGGVLKKGQMLGRQFPKYPLQLEAV